MTMSVSDRLHLVSNEVFEDDLSIVRRPDGTFTIGVTEEKAVDSYNQSFTCYFTATKEQAAQIAAFFANPQTPEASAAQPAAHSQPVAT